MTVVVIVMRLSRFGALQRVPVIQLSVGFSVLFSFWNSDRRVMISFVKVTFFCVSQKYSVLTNETHLSFKTLTSDNDKFWLKIVTVYLVVCRQEQQRHHYHPQYHLKI